MKIHENKNLIRKKKCETKGHSLTHSGGEEEIPEEDHRIKMAQWKQENKLKGTFCA